jgi:hypothetical protein
MSISTLTELLPVGVGFLVTAFTVLFASIKESRQEYTGRVMIVVNVAIWISILHMYGYLLPEPVRFVSESIALYIGIPIATIAALAYLRGDSLPSTFYDITHTLFGSPTLVLLFGFFRPLYGTRASNNCRWKFYHFATTNSSNVCTRDLGTPLTRLGWSLVLRSLPLSM